MIIYLLIVITFLLIIGLFTLILNPNWLEKIRLILKIKTSNSSTYSHTANEDNPTANDTDIQIKTDNEESEKLAEIRGKLEVIRLFFGDVSSTGEIKLFSIIDNIKDYLHRIKPTDYFLLETLENLIDRIDITRPADEPFPKMNEIALQLLPMQDLLNQYFSSTEIYSKSIQPFYKSALSELSEELKKFRKLKAILENAQTIDVYQLEKDQHSKSYRYYLFLFFFSIFFAFVFAYFSINLKEQLVGSENKNIIDYWILKASGMFIFITLITFFLKQAIHHQKKRDQVEKIMLELKALPAYMAELNPDDATSLRKDLASKYFGNTSDHSTINDLSNIVNEQLKTSIELIKVFNIQKDTKKSKDEK